MQELCLIDDLLRVPAFFPRTEIGVVVGFVKLAGEQVVWPMGYYNAAFAIKIVDYLHVKLVLIMMMYLLHYSAELKLRWLNDH